MEKSAVKEIIKVHCDYQFWRTRIYVSLVKEENMLIATLAKPKLWIQNKFWPVRSVQFGKYCFNLWERNLWIHIKVLILNPLKDVIYFSPLFCLLVPNQMGPHNLCTLFAFAWIDSSDMNDIKNILQLKEGKHSPEY